MKKLVMRVGAVVFTIAVFLFFGFLSIFIPAFTPAFYRSQFEKYDSLGWVQEQARYLSDPNSEDYDPAAAAYVRDMTDEELMNLMMHTMRYCAWLEDDLNITVDGQTLKVFRKDEVSHMKDVKGVFGGGMLIVLIFTLLGIGYAVFALADKQTYIDSARKIPYYTLLALAAILAVIGIGAAIDFDAAFELFHRIFFTGNWSFADGVMIAMIGPIFLDIVPIIIAVWVGLTALFVGGLIWYHSALKKRFVGTVKGGK